MYTTQEINRAKEIIKQIARENHVSEQQVRKDMQEAMSYGRNNPDPMVQARWRSFKFRGSEPMVEEFILWAASLAIE